MLAQNGSNSFAYGPCFGQIPTTSAFVLAFIATPFHVLVLLVVCFRLRLRNPGHCILVSLSASDLIQLVFRPIVILFSIPFAANEPACENCRLAIKFLSTVATVTASGSIVALSIERYIACIHSLRVHTIVTSKRVARGLYLVWITAILCGLLVTLVDKVNNIKGLPVMSYSYTIMYSVFVTGSMVPLIYVQLRLYKLSREKIRTAPVYFGVEAEKRDGWKRQMKLSAAASAVIVLYMICMFPKVIMFLYQRTHHFVDPLTTGIAVALMQLNVFVDPFLYGLGMSDVRKDIIKEFRKLKRYLQERGCLKDEIMAEIRPNGVVPNLNCRAERERKVRNDNYQVTIFVVEASCTLAPVSE